jgi:cytochrome c2
MSSAESGSRKGLSIAIWITIALIVLIGGVFLYEVVSFSEEATAETDTVEQLEARAAGLLERGDAERGAQLIETHQCAACHVIGAENDIAPAFVGLADRAGERNPPLSAAGYVYESIINPSAYIVAGYQNAMVQNFKDRVSEQDLADLMAYLLMRTSSAP